MESQRRIELIEHAPAEVREQALALLDELTRPYMPNDLEKALVPYYTRAKAKEIVKALGFFHVVLLHPDPTVPTKHNRSDWRNGTPARFKARKGRR
jgi:hypothetical protein